MVDYAPITASEKKYGSLLLSIFFDDYPQFKPKERNHIMTSIAEKIKNYEKARELEIIPKKTQIGNEEIIDSISIKSKDGILEGLIDYDSGYRGGEDSMDVNAKIFTKINFNSKDERDKEEYMGLARLLGGTAVIYNTCALSA